MICRALILDLDGTVLGPDEKISPTVVEAVRRVSGMIPVCIATGRERGDVLRFSNVMGLSAPQMSDNGALILNPETGEALWSAPLGVDLAMRAMRPIIESGWEFIATHLRGTITDIADLDSWDLTRISALDLEESVADTAVERMSGEAGLEVVKVWLPYNGLWAVDFTRKGVNKGSSLRQLCTLLRVETSQTIAVGDSFNDVPMLRTCGLGIAMGSSPPEVRDVAAHIVGSVVEDGVVEAIERYVLPSFAGSSLQ